MKSWKNDEELFALMKEKLYTPVVGDILDQMGYSHQFLPPEIRPLAALAPMYAMAGQTEHGLNSDHDMEPGQSRKPGDRQKADYGLKLAGYACTVLEQDIYGRPKKPFGYLTEALDQLRPNEIYVATGAHNSALWGELLTATAKMRGAAGAVLDGYTRDTPQVLGLRFPVFARACWAQDSSIRTSVSDFRCDIEIGQVTVHDGDLVFGDMDGVLVIPRAIHEKVLTKALAKATGEKTVKQAILGGMSATEAFAKFGLL